MLLKNLKVKHLLIVFAVITGLVGQSGSNTNDISGYVVDASNGEALPYANVIIKEKDRGATTNAEGYFVIVNVSTGVCTLSVSYIGYKTKDLVVQNRPGRRPPLRIDLVPEAVNLEAVEVIADQYQIMKSSEDVSKFTVAPRQLTYLPNLGEVDIFRSLQLLPGISGSGDGSSALYVRGGTPDQNMILLDGMTIYQVDHFFGMFSAFNADAIKDVQVYKGGFPAKFGGRLSSVIEMTGRNGDRNRRKFSFGANMLSGQMLYETPTIGNGTWLLSVRRSYTDWIQSPFFNDIYKFIFGDDTPQFLQNRRQFTAQDSSAAPAFETQTVPVFSFYDINSKFSFTLSERDVVNFSVYVGNDNLVKETSIEGIGVRRPGGRPGGFGGAGAAQATRIDDSNTKWGNTGASLKWARRWNNRFYSNLQLSASRFISDFARELFTQGGPGINFNMSETNQVADLSFRWDNQWHLSEKHNAEFGVGFTDLYTQYQVTFFDTVTLADLTSESFQLNIYVQDKWRPVRSLDVTFGFRGTLPTYLAEPSKLLTFETVAFDADKFYLEPRLSFGWYLSDNLRLKGAWGLYHQFVNNILTEDVLQGNSNFWLVSDENFKPGVSEHWILGIQYENPVYLLALEGYYKTMDNLIEFTRRNQQNADFARFFFFGGGIARGVELLAHKKAGAFNGWISYTLADVIYDFPSLSEEIFPADHDKRHELKTVGTYKWGPWNLSATVIFASGIPYTSPESRYYIPLLNGDEFAYYHVSEKNGYRLPDYHRLDLSVYRNLQTPDFNWDFGISLFNVYNNQNISYREFDLDTVPVTISNVLLLGFTPTLFFKVSLK